MERFVYFRVDIGHFDKHQVFMSEYVDEFLIPAIVLLDADGNRIIHLDCRLYEDHGHRGWNDTHKLAEMLRKVAPK